MILGVSYLAVKVIFVAAGYLPSCAIQHGMIPAVLTTVVCIFAMIEKFPYYLKIVLSGLMILLPVLVFIATPSFMYWIHPDWWLEGSHLTVFIIYECLAVLQIYLAVAIKRNKVGVSFA
jgi:hypothetical protein